MKKLNNAKKRKGFTLIELIVVIAVIAVLAAILIPTMLNYSIRSHVSNANATASKLRDNVTYFMSQAYGAGFGMFMSDTAICDVEVIVTNGVWTLTTSDCSVFVNLYETQWTGSGSAFYGDGNGASLIAEDRLAAHLANSFVELNQAYIKFRLVGGVCSALYYTDGLKNDVQPLMPDFAATSGWDVDSFAWDGNTQGVLPRGDIVGTSPVLRIS